MTTIIELITYPHYDKLPRFLGSALNLLRTNLNTYVEGCCLATSTLDENDLEFLNLEELVLWVKEVLPSFEQLVFLEAAARLHGECYDDEIFDEFLVDEGDLFEVLLLLKDEYELYLCETKGE